MKKTITLILMMWLSVFVRAQEEKSARIQAEYDLYANTESPRILKTVLEATSDYAYFVTTFSNDKPLIEKADDLNITIKTSSKDQVNHLDFKDSILISSKNYRRNHYKIKEALPNLSWKINRAETKEIVNKKCLKATTQFRGRSYTAWFSPDIPISAGPWKFHGLPGLILEVYDETDRFHWYITKIKITKSSRTTADFFDQSVEYEEIDLKSYVHLKDGVTVERDKILVSKLPRGATFSTDYKRNGMELIYEWEN